MKKLHLILLALLAISINATAQKKNKAEVTGISFEPWHYRYVGKEIASEIMSRQICLEEYISELKAEKDELMRQQSNV